MPTSDPDCPFCEIVDRDDPDAREVYRDEHVVAFFPHNPATLGHTLVIPRLHVPDIWALDEVTAEQLARATMRLAAAVKRAVNPDGLNVIQSNGSAASQTVFHLHIHLVPRWEGDPIGRIWPPESNYSEEEKDEAWEALRAECWQGEQQVSSPVVPSEEDRRKHLDFIQAVITRMSAASSNVKGWLLPVVTATYGFALIQHSRAVALLGLAAVVLFMFLDANYLRQERAYRRLYDTVAQGMRAVPRFSLDPSEADDPIPASAGWRERVGTVVGRWVPAWSVWSSWSILPFYGALLLIGVGIHICAVIT